MEDMQLRPWTGRCQECQGELYGTEAEPDQWGRVLCPECREDQDRAEVALSVMEFVDTQLKRVLSDELRNQIWNAAAQKYHFPEETA